MGWNDQKARRASALIAALEIEYLDGSRENILTDERWRVLTTPILFSSIYDGETVDMNAPCEDLGPARILPHDTSILLPQEGEEIREMGTLSPIAEITTPRASAFWTSART